ncbi:IS110 family transposase [Babesia caballi]|nr:IS110 family transposase [Babesia caballi]
MRRHVGRCNARAGKVAIGITGSSLIPDELLQSLGQLGNEASTTSTQCLNNLINILTKLGLRFSNFTKKVLNLVGEGFDGLITTTPILPRDPQDPVDGFLQVGGAVKGGVYRGT